MDVDKYLDTIKQAGIVGAGGAGFPTYIKHKAKVNTFIINGVECEPLLSIDKYIMRNYTEEISKTINLISNILSTKYTYLGIKEKFKDIIEKFKKYEKKYNFKVIPIDNFYPAGDEQILVYEITKKLIPSGGIPLDVGVVVNNVGTIYNIYQAIYENKVVVDKFLTITGYVKEPINIKVAIGSLIKDILKNVDITIKDFEILSGGPMMGKLVNISDPITKTTSGLIILPKDHILIKRHKRSWRYEINLSKAACCYCHRCTDLCSRQILGHEVLPHKTMRQLNFSLNFHENVFYCSECGICELYACPMGLSPVKVNKIAKKTLKEKGKKIEKIFNIEVDLFYKEKRVPTDRLIERLNISDIDYAKKFKEIKNINYVKIPLIQHIGAKSIPVVNIGDKVYKGQLIAKIPDNSIGSNIFASIDGFIKSINKDFIEILN